MEVIYRHLRLLEADSDYPKAKAVLFGCPFDGTASYQAGSRFAPNAIREASQAIETYSPSQNRDLANLSICDLGDLELPFGNTERALNLIGTAITNLLNDHKIPITLGGEHLITFPIIKAFCEQCPDLMVIHLDAHADLRDEYLGERFSHATVMRRVLELVGESNLIQIGIRSGTEEEFALAERIGCRYEIGGSNLEQLHSVLGVIKEKTANKNIYLSLDLDILDPATLPGTGTPEPGGLSFNQLIGILSVFQAAKVAGMDMVELILYGSAAAGHYDSFIHYIGRKLGRRL